MSLRTIACALLASQASAAVVKNAHVSVDAAGAVEKFDAKTDTDAGVETAQKVLAEMEDWAKSGERPEEPKIKTIDRLAKELEDALMKTHASAQKQVDENIEAIKKCNGDQEKSFTSIRATLKVEVGKQRTTHAQCRDAEVELFEDMVKKCTHLTEWLKQTTEDGPEEPKGAGDDEMVEYVEKMSAYWCKKGEAAEEKQKICEKGKEDHLTQKEKCDEKQRTFESGFCIWRTRMIDICTIHDTCYTDAKNAYDGHAKSTEVLVKKWKTEYTALKKILCYVNVWLSDGDHTTVDAGELETCQKLKPDCSQMDINFGDAPPANECSLEEVANHPGTDAFKTNEYQKWAKFVSEPNSCLEEEKPPPQQGGY